MQKGKLEVSSEVIARFSSVTQSCLTLCDPMNCSMPGLQNLLKFMSIESVMPSSHLICHPLLLPPSIFPCIFSIFVRWPKYWSFSSNISPSNEYSGLISFRMEWFDFLAAQGTLKSLLQHHSSKASVLQRSGFFMVQLSHPYTWLLEKPQLWLYRPCQQSEVSAF